MGGREEGEREGGREGKREGGRERGRDGGRGVSGERREWGKESTITCTVCNMDLVMYMRLLCVLSTCLEGTIGIQRNPMQNGTETYNLSQSFLWSR